MEPVIQFDGARVFHGDCRDVLAALPDNSVDSIVTDPPYELGFMGKSWDASGIAYNSDVWEQCLRVLKPGGHLLAFGGSRTWHRLAVAIEDAGFEIRDNIARFYGDPHYCGCEFPEPQMVNWSYGTGEPQAEHGVRSVRHTDISPTLDVETERREVLQPVVSEQGLSSTKRAESSQGYENGKESSLEGRGDVQATEGELYRGEVRSSAGVGETDGAERRLHHGASSGDGSDVRVSFDSDGSSEPQRPQSGEQSPVEPRVVSDERRPQAGRSWPICARCGKPVQPTSSANLAWVMGSGFPKSLDVSKAIDKKLGAEREVIATGYAYGMSKGQEAAGYRPADYESKQLSNQAITEEAEAWQGWGTALKPAFEPIVVARKPLSGTVAETVLEWGTGGLNIDGSRIGTNELKPQERGAPIFSETANGRVTGYNREDYAGAYVPNVQGRWPANVILDEVTAGLLDEQSGVSRDGIAVKENSAGRNIFSEIAKPTASNQGYGGKGGASRFFYCAKASKRDRNEGLEDLEAVVRNDGRDESLASGDMPQNRSNNPKQNFHPTVKPTALMRYLVKLVTPPGGTVLDPFTGSGSTGKAAILEGFDFVGVELTGDYLPIIEGRLKWALENQDEGTLF